MTNIVEGSAPPQSRSGCSCPRPSAPQQHNVIEVVVGSGPFAGTYKPTGGGMEMGAPRGKRSLRFNYRQLWRDLTPTSKTVLAEAGGQRLEPQRGEREPGTCARHVRQWVQRRPGTTFEVPGLRQMTSPCRGAAGEERSRSSGRRRTGFRCASQPRVRTSTRCDVDPR